MTIMPVETGSPSSYEAWNEAMDKLRDLAAELGLNLDSWGAVPADPPKIKIGEDGTWTCPHCANVNEDLAVWFTDGSQGFATPMNTDDEPDWKARAREFVGHKDIQGNYWDLTTDVIDAEAHAYVCLECNGFVSPEDPVVIS